MALNERGVNCLRGIFTNFEGIMKINAELQKRIKETNTQNCFKMISEKQSVVLSKQSVVLSKQSVVFIRS